MAKIMWAWREAKGDFCHIYRREMLVRLCSPDGFKNKEARGEGKVVRVRVTEVKR